MARNRLQVFLAEAYAILREPDSPHRLRVEPVYEVGQLGLHVFYPQGDRIQEIDAAIEAWNQKFPLMYMTRAAVPDCYTETSYGNGFVHIPLAPAAAMWAVDYEVSDLFSGVRQQAQSGVYRSEFQRKRFAFILMMNRRLGASEEQFRHYTALNNVLVGLHLSPNYFRVPNVVAPVYENHSCALHIFHEDRGALEMVRLLWRIRNPVVWGEETRGCKADESSLHLGLGEYSAYLISTQVFAEVLRRRRR